MIILSFNARGVQGVHIQLALKWLCENYRPDVMMIHEMMCLGKTYLEFFSNSFIRLDLFSINAVGQFGALIIEWNNNFSSTYLSVLYSRFLVDIFF